MRHSEFKPLSGVLFCQDNLDWSRLGWLAARGLAFVFLRPVVVNSLGRFAQPCRVHSQFLDLTSSEVFGGVLDWFPEWLQQFCGNQNRDVMLLESQKHSGLICGKARWNNGGSFANPNSAESIGCICFGHSSIM